MPETFETLYAATLKEVFRVQARERVGEGGDGLAWARTYAEMGKPDFALAYLLLSDAPDETKREILASAFERRAALSEEKARSYRERFHRTFPLINLGARNDRVSAKRVREGQPLGEQLKP